MDLLKLTERIAGDVELGESQFREFKSAWEGPPEKREPREPKIVAKDIGEALVGFANADGGDILIGVEDDGVISGISYNEATVLRLLEAPKSNVHAETPLKNVVAREVSINGKRILYFSVEKGTEYVHLTSDGRCLQRRDRQTVPVTAEQLQFERQEQISREYDRQFVDGASPADLDSETIERVSQHVTRGMSAEKCLQFLGVAEYGLGVLQLRRSALLLFARDVTRWHPRCEVRIVRARGIELLTGREYNVVSDEVARGNILQLLTTAWEKLRPHLVETKFAPDAIFKERAMYPEDACREALINAVAHRDYNIEGRNIEIFIFDDRMEVNSPGGLLSTVRIDDLRKLQGLHQSRNALIARVLREIGYMREIGEGMRRIFRLMTDNDLVAPELKSEPNRFSLILRHRSVFSDADQQWVDGFKPFYLTRQEMRVVLLGKSGNMISPQDIIDTLGVVDTDDYRVIVEQLQIKGILFSKLSNATAMTKAKLRGAQRRSIKRLAIRHPTECEMSVRELLETLSKSHPSPVIGKYYLEDVINRLPVSNAYRSTHNQLAPFLRIIGLVTDDKHPTTRLEALWRERRASVTSPTPTSNNTTQDTAAPFSVGPAARSVQQPKAIYVGNLNYETTERDLRSLFGEFGEVLTIDLPEDYIRGGNRGFAFVGMRTLGEAEAAMEALENLEFKGRILRIGWGRDNK